MMEAIHPFSSVGLVGALLLGALYFGAFFVKGVFGLGAMPPLVVLGAWIIESHHAVILAVILNTFTQLQFIPEIRLRADRSLGPAVLPYFAVALVGGVWVFGRLETAELSAALGIALGVILLADYGGVLQRLMDHLGQRAFLVAPVMSALAGFLAGVTGAAGIIFLSLYIKTLITDARAFRATILLVAAGASLWRCIVYAAGGFITAPLVVEAVVLLPVSMLGAWVGSRFFKGLADERYFQAFRAFLIVSAFGLVWKGLSAMN